MKLYWECAVNEDPYESDKFKQWFDMTKSGPGAKKKAAYNSIRNYCITYFTHVTAGKVTVANVTAAFVSKLFGMYITRIEADYKHSMKGIYLYLYVYNEGAANNQFDLRLDDVIMDLAIKVLHGGVNEPVWDKKPSLPAEFHAKFPASLLDDSATPPGKRAVVVVVFNANFLNTK